MLTTKMELVRSQCHCKAHRPTSEARSERSSEPQTRAGRGLHCRAHSAATGRRAGRAHSPALQAAQPRCASRLLSKQHLPSQTLCRSLGAVTALRFHAVYKLTFSFISAAVKPRSAPWLSCVPLPAPYLGACAPPTSHYHQRKASTGTELGYTAAT